MAGFEDIGALIGVPANNELAYQKGLALGTNTQNALQQARQRVRENAAREQGTQIAEALGLSPALVDPAWAAGADLGDIAGAALKGQEYGFRHDIADTNVPLGVANRKAMAVQGKPVGQYEAVGTHGYQDIFNPDKGIQALPPGAVGSSGGIAGPIQVLQAFGLLDANGHVLPGQERRAFDVMRTTGKTVDEGGVPGVVDFNPYAMAPPAPGAAPAAPAGVASLVAGLAPPAPTSAPPVSAMPPTAAPQAAPTAVAGTGAVQPVSSAGRVGSNAAEIERQKVIGKGAGEAAIALPDAVADAQRLGSNIRNLLTMPGFNGVYGNIQGQGPVAKVSGVLDQDTANAQAQLKNIDAQTFGIAIQKMRGLGQLSNMEGMRVTDAFTRATNPLISEQEARTAWGEVLTYLDAAEARAARKTQLPGAVPPSTNPAAPTTGAAPYADPAKEARYQAWKAAQGR